MRPDPKGIVVGVDGSDSSTDAVRWALDEAHRRGTVLTLVYAWQLGVNAPYATRGGAEFAAVAATVEAFVDRLKGRLQNGPGGQEVTIRAEAIEGPAGPVLVAAAKDADLLVVGSGGAATLAGTVLGSVSTHCVHHAKCTTVLVPRPPSGKHRRRRTLGRAVQPR